MLDGVYRRTDSGPVFVQADPDEARALRALQVAACTCRVAFGPRVGQVVRWLKTAWRDGATRIVMSPLKFMQRLEALVPRPRLHLIRFHRVLAPDAKLRVLVVPHGSHVEDLDALLRQ